MKRQKKTRADKVFDPDLATTAPRVRCYWCSQRTRTAKPKRVNGAIHFICQSCTGQ